MGRFSDHYLHADLNRPGHPFTEFCRSEPGGGRSLGKRRLRRHAAIDLPPNFPIGGSTTHHQLLRMADDQTSLVGAPFLSLEPSESCLADSAPLLRSFCSCFHNISDLQKMVLLHPGSHLRNAFASAPLLLRNAPFLSLRYPAHTFNPSFPGCQHASQSKRGSVHELAL